MLRKQLIGAWVVTAAISAILFISQPCHAMAQRTMSGQSLLTAETAALSLVHPGDISFDIDYGQYLLTGYWYASLYTDDSRIATTTKHSLRYTDVYVGGGYLHRTFSNRSRSFSLYCGGSAFLGYEFIDPAKECPTSISISLPSGCFLYGIIPEVEMEIFIQRRIALSMGAESPIYFTSPLRKIRPRVKLGVRVNI